MTTLYERLAERSAGWRAGRLLLGDDRDELRHQMAEAITKEEAKRAAARAELWLQMHPEDLAVQRETVSLHQLISSYD